MFLLADLMFVHVFERVEERREGIWMGAILEYRRAVMCVRDGLSLAEKRPFACL